MNDLYVKIPCQISPLTNFMDLIQRLENYSTRPKDVKPMIGLVNILMDGSFRLHPSSMILPTANVIWRRATAI